MTITEIAVDLIRERDQLKKQLGYWKEMAVINQKGLEKANERIAKAKALLQALGLKNVEAALEALEGK